MIERREGEDAVELLSLHSHHAERWPETWRYSVLAAERAWEKHANAEAAQFFERALEAAQLGAVVTSIDLTEVWEGLGDARMRLGDYERGGEAFRASREAHDGGAVEDARLMQKEAVALLRLTRYPDALERLTAALKLLDGVEGGEETGSVQAS